MKTPLMLAFLLLCGIAPLLHATSDDSLELILNESLAASPEPSKVMATLSQKSTIFVIGKARSLKMADNEYIVQCVWSHLGAIGPQKSSVKALRKPLTSTYKTRGTILEKGLKLSAKGPQKLFWEDMEALFNKGSTNERPGQADIILSDKRHVEGEHQLKGRRKGSETLALLSAHQTEAGSSQADVSSHGGYQPLHTPLNANESQQSQAKQGSLNSQTRSNGSLSYGGANLGVSPMSGAGALPIGNSFVTARENQTRNTDQNNIQVTITKEGCTPRIDEARGLVIIQVKAITRKNGTITETSAVRHEALTC